MFCSMQNMPKEIITKCKEMSLHQYFHHIKNPDTSKLHSNRKCIIPHYVGARSVPTYPPTEGYAKSVLILHVPWRNTFNEQDTSRNYVKEFESFLKSGLCPMSVQVGYESCQGQICTKETVC